MLLLALLLISVCSMAQVPAAIIKITVLAENRPVPGASVTVNGASYTTDQRGFVEVQVSPGEVEVSGAAEGFLPAATKLQATAGQAYDLTLELGRELGEEITVSATRTNARIEDLPTRVEVLNREEIEEKVLMTPGDIVMMLNEMGGMRVQTTSPSLGAASIRIQGMRGRYTRFLSDGLPLFGQQVGGLGLLQIPPSDLAQVEVIKGTASALYGAGAMGGVVNLVSRRPTDSPFGEFLLNQSTRGASDVVFFGSTPLKASWGATLLAGGHFQHKQDLDDDGWADLAGYSRGVLRPRFYWQGDQGSTLFITSGVTAEDRSGGTFPGRGLAATGEPFVEALRTLQVDVGTIAQIVAGPKTLFTVRASAVRRMHEHRFGDVVEHDVHNSLFGEVTARRSFRRHTLVAGIAFERDWYLQRELPQFAYTHHVPGFFLQDDFNVTDWLSASASARVDVHSTYGTFFSPRVSVLLKKGAWSSRLSAGQGFFAPTPLTEETEAAGLSRLSIPRPLRAEQGRSMSVDISRDFGAVTLTATFFGSTIQNPLQVTSSTYTLVNLPNQTRNHGLEFLATAKKNDFSLTGSYSFVRAREDDGLGQVDAELTPRHSAGLVAMWEKEKTGRVGFELYYTGRQRLEANPYRSQSRPYVVAGVLVERRIGAVRLFINAENITDVRQTQWDPLLRRTRAPDGRWTVDAWSPLEGRVFNGGIRWQF